MYLLTVFNWERKIDHLIGHLRLEEQYLHNIREESIFSPKHQQTTRQKKELRWQKSYRGSWDVSGCKNNSKHLYRNIEYMFWLNCSKISQLSLISWLNYYNLHCRILFRSISPFFPPSLSFLFVFTEERRNRTVLF